MKRKIVIAILCAAVSMGTVGCGNSTASAKTTQTQTDKKEDSKSENSEKSSEEKQSRDIFAMDTYMTVTAYGEHASKAVDKAETEIKRLDGMLSTGNENSEVYKLNPVSYTHLAGAFKSSRTLPHEAGKEVWVRDSG